ncbi:MAG: glycosyl transferase family 1, partial [Polyangiaceae bacterium]|nr:glycosyl transferase family 1 [Polyangiaceae bacterium]
MARIREVHVGVEPISRFAALAGEERMRVMEKAAATLRERYTGRALFNVNSTAVGGGVAEMLRPLLSYARGVGLDARWIVIGGDAEFFRITKRLHHALHGSVGDGSDLGTREHRHYQQVLDENARELLEFVRPGDGVILHDPQTAGLTSHLVRAGARVVWRCHIGTEHRNEEVDRAVAFLAPYIAMAELHIFSRKAFLDMGFNSVRSAVVHPSVDAFSPKNAPMTREAVEGILVQAGLFEGPACPGAHTSFVQLDGTPGRVERHADVVRFGSAPKLDQPLVLQVSRWDPLKDPIGVLRGFEAALAAELPVSPHLVLAGPNVRGVADDPEAAATLDSVIEALRAMPEHVRS